MAYFTAIEPDAATGKTAELFAQAQKALGSNPNMTKVMANSPTLLKSYLSLFSAVSGGSLPAAVRARLAIATAQLNGCEYCLSSHIYIGANISKVDEAELDKARRGESDDPHVAALLQLSNNIAQHAGDIGESDLEVARKAGVTEEEVGEIVANLALNTMTNYFNIMARLDNDWPIVPL